MAWRSLTEADVRSVLSDSELAALSRAAGPDGLAEHIALACSDVAATVRGYVAADARNSLLGPAGTVPAGLRQAALAILAVDLPARLGGLSLDPRGVRKDSKAAAVKLLESVAAGRFLVEDARGSIPSVSPAAPTSYSKPRVSTRDRQRGVL